MTVLLSVGIIVTAVLASYISGLSCASSQYYWVTTETFDTAATSIESLLASSFYPYLLLPVATH